MQQHGVSVPPLLEKFGLTPAALDEDNTLLPMDNVARLLEASSLAAACPDMGLQMARHQTLGALGMLGFVIKTASSAAEVTDIVTRFMSLQGSALRLRLDPPGPLVPGAFSIMLWIKGARPEDSRQVIDLLLGKAFQIGRLRAPWRAKVRAVSLPHDLAGNTDSHRQFFGVPVHVNQPVAALHLDSAGWNRPDPDHDPLYRQVNITALEPAYSTPSQLVSDRVRWALRPLIGTQRANRTDVARILAIEPRTLHRQLRAENTSFQEIKETMRKELALRYLTETDLALGLVSSLLGFPEQSSLSRACRKWFGHPPGAIRKAGRPPDATRD